MWTRSLLKNNAKAALTSHYWRAFAVCIITTFLVGGSFTASGSSVHSSVGTVQSGEYLSIFSVGAALLLLVVMLVVFVLIIAFSLLVSNVAEAGQARYFMEARIGNAPVSSIFSTFKMPGYWNIVKTMFLRMLYVALWSLLFIIPGIIKTYQYCMVPYILA